MKRILMFVFNLCLCLAIYSDSQTLNSDVSFIASPFVRIGFSSTPVETSVEPVDSLKRDSASFKIQNGEYVTGNYYLYAQVFTVELVNVTIDEAEPLQSTTTGVNIHNWSTTFMQWGNNKNEISTVYIDTSDFSGISLFNETPNVDTAYPRTYCWTFNVVISQENAPSPSATSIEPGYIKAVVKSVE